MICRPDVDLDTASASGIVGSSRRLHGHRGEMGRSRNPVGGAEDCYQASSRVLRLARHPEPSRGTQPSGGVLATDTDRPHRSRALHGAAPFGEATPVRGVQVVIASHARAGSPGPGGPLDGTPTPGLGPAPSCARQALHGPLRAGQVRR